jgi:hypothetical protein
MGKPGVFKKIDSSHKTITPFKVYKSWRYEGTSSLDADNLDRLVAIKPNPNKYSGNKVTLNTWQTQIDSASLLVNLANQQPASMVWYSLNHLYYKRAGQPYETFGYADPIAIERTLFNEAYVISVPQKKFGESIKPGSVKLNFKNTALNAISMSLTDDGKGNLIDTVLSSSISNELLYVGFNSSTYNKYYHEFISSTSSLLNSNEDINSIYVDSLLPELNVTAKKIHISPNTGLTIGATNWGNAAYMYGKGYIRIPNRDEFNFKRSSNFAVSFWLRSEHTGNSVGYILTKRTTGTGETLSNKIINTGDVNYNATQYPFEILCIGNSLIAKQSIGTSESTITTSITANTPTHIVFQQTGSLIELYVNGTFVSNSHVPKGNIHNNSDIFIGSLGIDSNKDGIKGLQGAIREFFIFDKGLTQSEIAQLASNELNTMSTNTNAVGNVFYEHGIIVVSDPRAKYGTAEYKTFNDRLYNYISAVTQSAYINDFSLEYNSTLTLYEYEFICNLKEDEFNFTSNPTIRLDNNPNSEIPKDFVGSNYFSPYITTIGLYTDSGELVAVGKLGTPIKKRDDVDLSLIVRFDV